MTGKTLIEYFYHNEKAHANKDFLKQPFGETWETYTWKEGGQMARKLAAYFRSLNLKPNSHIGLVSKNCREWVITDLAIMMAGHVSVPFFPTLTGDQINEVLKLGDVDLLCVGKMEGWDDMGQGVPDDMPIVRFPHYQGNSEIKRGKAWSEIMSEFEPITDNHIPKMDELWTIIFTSGTTGTPKGVMHTYKIVNSLIEEAFAVKNPLSLDTNGNNQFFSFLPLNHIAERAVVEMMCLRYGGTIAFTESIDRFAANLKDIRPTIFFAVPRIYAKFKAGILAKMPQKKMNLLLKIPILSGIVKKKVKSGLGLERSRCTAVGAAPIAQETKDWFKKLGIEITEGYGMTENCAATSFLFPHEDKPGSVGLPHDGTTVKIDPETQEILVKSNYIMKGYYKDEAKTAETIKDGWLYSGDQGKLDNEGYIYITGRVKDTFKSAKAKFIVPSEIEAKFETSEDLEQMCIVGLGMPQPMLLVALNETAQKAQNSDVERRLQLLLDKVNDKLPNYKKVANVIVMKEAFSIEKNTLTPTLKVKRPQVHNEFKNRMLAWCESGQKVIWE